MYYDVTDCIEIDSATGIATITIQNIGTGVLAVNNIKLTGDATMTTVTEEDMPEVKASMEVESVRADVINGVVTTVVEEDVTPDNGDNTTGDNTTGDDTTVEPGAGGTTTGTTSFIEQLIAMLIEIIMGIFDFLPVGEVM
jgi:hypothetical protein